MRAALFVGLLLIGPTPYARAQATGSGKADGSSSHAGPRAVSAAEIAATHVLTIDEMRRWIAVAGDLVAAERSDPAVKAAFADGLAELPLDTQAAALGRVAPVRHLLARRGFTPAAFVVTQLAMTETLQVVMGEPRDPGTDRTSARAKNLALYRRHSTELESMLATMGKKTFEADGIPELMKDTTFVRRLRTTDSLSRLVRTDSLARLWVRAIDAPESAVPALAVEINCEMVRLHWRHGIAPGITAIRRMRDSLWAGRIDVYQRTNARMYAYAMAAPMTDAVCGQSRWPRAADSLNVRPAPTEPTPGR